MIRGRSSNKELYMSEEISTVGRLLIERDSARESVQGLRNQLEKTRERTSQQIHRLRNARDAYRVAGMQMIAAFRKALATPDAIYIDDILPEIEAAISRYEFR